MTDPTPAGPGRAPAWKPLDARQRRVLGVLIEKAKTTPAGYPMSVNAIVTGCNQKNNRDPLTSYDDIDVEKSLDELRIMGAVSEVDWLGRVSKYKHHAYEWMGVSRPELAVMAELLLRGAQQLGELRARAARMEPIPDLGALKPLVDALVGRGLMLELTPPGRGQVVSHNLYTPSELAEVKARLAGGGAPAAPSERATATGAADAAPARERTVAPAPATHDRLTELAAEVTALRDEVARLRERIEALES
jgi:uncharacterized protein YceH (UPF0502 family)